MKRSITLVSGSAGIGKSTMGMHFLLEGAKHQESGIYITVEEGEDQILNTADALGLPLRQAVKRGLIKIIYLARENVRGTQFAAILTEKIGTSRAQRLVLDSASHIVSIGKPDNDELRQLLYSLIVRFKALDVTSIFTVESQSMFSTESITDRDFSPIADNLFMLRYINKNDALQPTLTVVKTRGTRHERGTYLFEIGKGGMRIGKPLAEKNLNQPKPPSAAAKTRRKQKR